MSELAFNVNGEPFELPAAATGWRVRKLKQKGAPEVVYGRDGIPLVLPIDAELEDLRREAGTPGRYRLDPVDDGNRPISGAPAGYVFIHPTERPIEGPVATALPAASDNVAIEAMRMNAEIARSVIDRFPMMMEAAAILIRAADGAGLPARPGMLVEETETDGDDAPQDLSKQGTDLTALFGQLVPFLMSIAGKKVPNLASMLDWRKASPVAQDQPPAAKAKQAPAKPVEMPPLDPKTMTHFIAVQSALTAEEAALARELASELSPAELRAWFDELAAMSVPDAVAKIRAVLGGEKGGAS